MKIFKVLKTHYRVAQRRSDVWQVEMNLRMRFIGWTGWKFLETYKTRAEAEAYIKEAESEARD